MSKWSAPIHFIPHAQQRSLPSFGWIIKRRVHVQNARHTALQFVRARLIRYADHRAQRKLGYSSLEQLAFVLDRQAGVVQTKLNLIFVYIMQKVPTPHQRTASSCSPTMAHDGSSDDESTFLDVQDTVEDDTMLPESTLPLEVKLSPSSSSESPLKLGYPASIGRPKAVSASAAPISLSTNKSDAGVENSTIMTPIAANSAAPAAYLVSAAHSESALMSKGVAPPPPPISVRPATDTKPNGFMTMGGNLLSGMVDFAGIKSPRGTMQKVHVVYPTPGPLYVDLYSRDDGTGARVKGFRRTPDGTMADAEASGQVYPGDELVSINAVDVTKMVFADIITTAKEATFPLSLTFHCFLKNREEHDKQIQEKPIQPERKHLSGPLPPMSPSSSAGWGARLSQMTRSGSFEQKTTGSDLTIGAPRSPSSPSSETNGGKFGFSLGKVGTDGVKKNLFRMMGNKPSRPEEDKNVVKGWMNDLALKPHNSSTGGRHRKTPANTNTDVLHSTPIVAVTTGGRFVGVLDDDVNEFSLTWFRKTPPEMDIRQIKGVKRCPYFPSVDDVGAILSLQCESLRFPQLKRVVEMSSPLVLDPAVGNTVDVLLEAGAGSFSATLASNEHDSFQIKISPDDVILVKISEDEDEGGVVVKAAYSTFLQVLLDPADQLRFTLKVQEFGGFLDSKWCRVTDDNYSSSGAVSSPAAGKNRLRLQSEGSLTSISSARLSDLVGLEPDDAADPTKERSSDVTPAATPPRSAMISSKNGFSASSTSIAGDNVFIEGRLAAQDKEIAMLREKLSSMSVLLKTAEQENKQVTASLEVKDNRIELQQMKLRQFEKFPGQCDAQAREIQALRTKLEDEERKHAHCKEELQQVLNVAAKRAAEMTDQGVQTEAQFLDGEGFTSAVVSSGSGWERDAWSGTVATVSASDLQQQIKDQQLRIAQLQDEQVKLVTKRNMFRAKSLELSKELRRLVGANNNRPLDDLETQLAERSTLQAELAFVKADAKSTADELAGLKSVLDNVGDKDKGAKRLAAQNAELQRTVHQLQDSLSEARDQVDAVKKINSALALRLHRLQPETRGSIVEELPISPPTGFPAFTSDDEDDDDDEEEEDEELKDGLAEFRRSLVGHCTFFKALLLIVRIIRHQRLMGELRSVFRRLWAVWMAMQVEFHGRYSLERLGRLNSYMQTASLCRVMSVAFLSSFPCLVLAILVEAVPLAAPEDGVRANWVFLIRFGFVTGLMVGSMVFQMGQNVPALIVKTRHIITIAVLSAGAAVITLYAVASATVFPVPFTMLLASPPSIVMYGICFAIFWGAQFKADPSIQKEMEQQTTVLNCQISLTLIYPMYIFGFTSFTGAYQTIFVVVLPIIKLIAKNWVSRALAGHNDFKPEAVIFNVEVFNALYISNALQVASTQASTVTIMAVDLLHFWLSMYDVVEILKQVKVLMNKIPEENPIGKENFLQVAMRLLDLETQHMSESMDHFSDVSHLSHPTWKDQIESWVNSNVPATKRNERRMSELGHDEVNEKSPSQTRKPSLGTRVFPVTTGQIQGWLQAKRSLSSTITRGTKSMPDSSSSLELAAVFSQNERALFIRESARVLFITEYIVLVEYVEVVLPLVYRLCT
ncbi:hypothetical protein GQ600_15182 [Phytophthora cactorum]|nr:hypothetical protein GQ600_15182 [Phytophthora cactorum]